MSGHMGDPNLRVETDNGPSGGRLVMTDEAVQGWVRAYRKYAKEMDLIAQQIADRDRTTFFGDLDSLRQLAAGYDNLMYSGPGSLHQRVKEFSAAANQFADKLLQNWADILAADGQTAAALAVAEPRL